MSGRSQRVRRSTPGRNILRRGSSHCKRHASQRKSSLHGLRQGCSLVSDRDWVVTVPQLLLDMRLVLASPLFNKSRHIGDRVVVASRIALSEAFSVCPESLIAPVGFKRNYAKTRCSRNTPFLLPTTSDSR